MRRALPRLVLLLAMAGTASAHEGPPYPIAMDEPIGPYEVSVWTDPDVGTGTFWVVLVGAEDESRGAEVRVEVRPRDRDGDWTSWPSEIEPSGEGEMHVAEIPFDREEWARVRVVVEGPDGGGELLREVEVTPPGMGPWLDFTLYLFPFVAVGFLLIKAALKRREIQARAAASGARTAVSGTED